MSIIKKGWDWGWGLFDKYVILRYVASGGTSAVVDLLLLSFLYHVVGVHYLLSSIIAFCVAFFVSFILQKFWTFKNVSTEGIQRQSFIYLASSLFSLGVNTLLMYIFVEKMHLAVLLSQIFAGATVACFTFFISRRIFKYKTV
ncbi:MAG: GtrA family protein [Patescibacteria group bacterium]